MIGNRTNIGSTHFEAENLSEIFGLDLHQVGFILDPETRFEYRAINGIQWSIPRNGRKYFPIIKKMKTMIIGKTKTAETYITSEETIYIWAKQLTYISLISLDIKIIFKRNIREYLYTRISRTPKRQSCWK